jgi:glycerol-3-phosphate O-acyltransferase
MQQIVDDALTYPKLLEYLNAHPESKSKVKACLNEIKGNFNPNLVKSAIRFIDATFGKLYDGVNLEVPQGFDLASLSKEYNIILVPNHQSHADYIALTYALFGVYEVPIFIAGGINLNIFPIGSFFRNSGAFFIRRSFQNDMDYKIAFEAYVFGLLKNGQVVEFFFEGGRSRTGKLLKPRFGLFQMLLEAHSNYSNGKPLMFLPVALAHEYIPEEKAHLKELKGGKKEAESSKQLFKVFKLFKKKLGTIHVRISSPIIIDKVDGDIKLVTQNLAFDCFKAVGKAMPITPSSLLSLIMLDESSGALTWSNILDRSQEILAFCERFNIPVTPSLKGDELIISLRKALDLFISNKKVEASRKEKLKKTFYSIKQQNRVDMLYSKNMILHHFLVPGFINSLLMSVFRGEIKTSMELTRHLMERRKEFKYEFYLPQTREMISQALEIIKFACGKELQSLDKSLDLTNEELFKLASLLKCFSTAFVHIYEAYYLACTAVSFIDKQSFTQERYIAVAKELFQIEIEHGRTVRYPESFTVPKMKDALLYLLNLKIITFSEENSSYQLANQEKLEEQMIKLTNVINDQMAINLKFNSK